MPKGGHKKGGNKKKAVTNNNGHADDAVHVPNDVVTIDDVPNDVVPIDDVSKDDVPKDDVTEDNGPFMTPIVVADGKKYTPKPDYWVTSACTFRIQI